MNSSSVAEQVWLTGLRARPLVVLNTILIDDMHSTKLPVLCSSVSIFPTNCFKYNQTVSWDALSKQGSCNSFRTLVVEMEYEA